jgi:CDP-diacylglycerol--glycerol-3-phosphate 3-phosphatidyltransferase
MFEQWVRRASRWLLVPIARFLGRMRISPNIITIVGFILNLGVAYVLAMGHLQVGGLLVLAAAGFDAVDGTLARETKKVSRFGAFLDSVMDRFSEATIYGGLLVFYMSEGMSEHALLIYAAIIGSLLVSYARARAEGVGVECKVGFFTRIPRVGVLVVGLLAGQMRIVLWILAVVTNLTAIQRVVHVWSKIGVEEG